MESESRKCPSFNLGRTTPKWHPHTLQRRSFRGRYQCLSSPSVLTIADCTSEAARSNQKCLVRPKNRNRNGDRLPEARSVDKKRPPIMPPRQGPLAWPFSVPASTRNFGQNSGHPLFPSIHGIQKSRGNHGHPSFHLIYSCA
jgi:hypothetical protein